MDEIGALLGIKSVTVRTHVLRGRACLLAHCLVNAPDYLGGIEAVEAAIRRLEREGDESLTPKEAEAVRARKGSAEALQKAMLKLGPYLGVLAFLTVLLLTGGGHR